MPFDLYDDAPAQPPPDDHSAARPYIGVLFECCAVYARVYRQPEDRVYSGRCPKCLRMLRVRVGRDGVSTRIFRAS